MGSKPKPKLRACPSIANPISAVYEIGFGVLYHSTKLSGGTHAPPPSHLAEAEETCCDPCRFRRQCYRVTINAFANGTCGLSLIA